jgi:hypothetical protein
VDQSASKVPDEGRGIAMKPFKGWNGVTTPPKEAARLLAVATAALPGLTAYPRSTVQNRPFVDRPNPAISA